MTLRTTFRVLCALLVAPAVAGAQGGGSLPTLRGLDTLPPRMLPVLAMRAKAADRVAAQESEWRQWAAAAPTSPAPRLALAQLARLDLRYDDAQAWADSAMRRATTVQWRAAIRRERLAAFVIRGEFAATDSLVAVMLADTAGLPDADKAEVLFARAGQARRVTRELNEAVLDTIAALASPSDSSIRARLYCLRAMVNGRRARVYADSAVSLALAAGLSTIAANCQLTIGTLYVGAGNMTAGNEWLRRADSLSRAVHDLPTLGAALQWRGYARYTLGYVQDARRLYSEAIRVAQRASDRNVEAWSLLGVATSARAIGDAATASAALQRAASLFDGTNDRLGALNARIERGQAMMLVRDYDGAEQLTRDARATADMLGSLNAAMRAMYQQADIAMRRGQLDVTAARLAEAEPYVAQLGDDWRTQHNTYRGMLSLRRGEPTLAIAQLTPVRSAYAQAQDLYLSNIDGALALAYLTLGDTAKAASLVDDAGRRLDAVRDTMAASGLRKVMGTVDFWGGTGDNIDKAMAAMVTSPRWLPTVFTVTERSRARTLLSGAVADEADTNTSALLAARRRVRASASQLVEAQRTLKPNTAMLVYAGGRSEARTALMLITRTSARGMTIAPLDTLDRDIVRWLALLESGESGTGAGQRVATAVLGTALRSLPRSITRLIVVPHGPLYRVPFHALPFGAGVLGDRVIVTVSPSVSLALTYAADPRMAPARVLALGAGDVAVERTDRQSLSLVVERTARGTPLAPLLAAGDEARAAANWAPGSLALTGADASETALKREARGAFTVLHAAAHALTSDQSLGANYLILRPDSLDDGYLSGGELATLSRGMSMVVLSGCRTTGDFGSRGDAVDGLVAPLLAGGVRTVLASHWAVSDRWTKVLMERFYQQLAAGATTAEALNTAQTSLRRAGVPARFWAAFSAIGDGALTFVSERAKAAH